jgi:hypothetical protein
MNCKKEHKECTSLPLHGGVRGLVVFWLMLLAKIDVVCDNVCCECYNSDTEAWKETAKHSPIGENRMFTPGLPLSPGISEKWKMSHLSLASYYQGGNILNNVEFTLVILQV